MDTDIQPETWLLSHDVETTGPNMKLNSMFEWGCCLFHHESNTIVSTFRVKIKLQPKTGWESSTRQWYHGELVKQQIKKGHTHEEAIASAEKQISDIESGIDAIKPDQAIKQFNDWLHQIHQDYIKDSAHIFQIVDTVSFDAYVLNYYIITYGAGTPPLHLLFGFFRDLIDTSSYGLGIARITLQARDYIYKRRGTMNAANRVLFKSKEPPVEHNHNALNDAIFIAWQFSLLMKNASDNQTALKTLNDTKYFDNPSSH